MSNGIGFNPSGTIADIGQMVDGAVTNWHQVTQQKQAFIASNPCNGAVAFAELAANWIGPAVDAVNGGAANLGAELNGAIRSSILARGEAVPGVVGGTALASFALQQSTGHWIVPGQGFAPPEWGGVVYLALLSELPSGSNLLNYNTSAWSSTSGNPVPGISGLYLTNGKLTGPTMAAWVRDWISLQVGPSGPSPAAIPTARAFLRQLVGTTEGSNRIGAYGYGTWQVGDDFSSGSQAARMNDVLADSMATLQELEDLCGYTVVAGELRETAGSILPFVGILAVAYLASRA